MGEEIKIPLLYRDLCGPFSDAEDSMTIETITNLFQQNIEKDMEPLRCKCIQILAAKIE